jgi:HK97 family phage major capsid protein
MTPEEIKSQVETLKGLVTQATEKVAADSKADITDLKGQIEGLTTKMVATSAEQQKHLDEIQANYQKLRDQGAGKAAAKMNVAQMVTKALETEYKETFEASKKTKAPFNMELKDVGTMTFGASTTGQVVDNTYVPGIFGYARRNARIRQFLPIGTTNGDKVPFVYQSGGEGAPTAIAEGVIKPKIDKDITLKEAPIRKIAGHMRISEELLNDLPAIQAFLTNQGIEDLLDVEDTMLLTGANDTAPNFTGLTIAALTAANINANVTTSNPNNWDAIIGGMSALATANHMADTILVNPADYYTMLMSKATSGGDYHNGNVLIQGGQVFVGGVPVSVSTAITAGSFLLGDFARGAQIFQREGISVRFFEQDQDNAIYNLVTIVLEERLTLARYYPTKFFYDSFSDVKSAITAS